MKKFNSLMMGISLVCSLTQLSAVTLISSYRDPNENLEVSLIASSNRTTPIQKEQQITLSQINQLRNEAGRRLVLVLIALTPLQEGASPRIPSKITDAGRVATDFNINGKLYDLWYPGDFCDLEKEGSRAEYKLENSIEEKWLSRYYRVRQGHQPGESENGLEITYATKNSKQKAFIFFGALFSAQKGSDCDSNSDYD